MKRDFDTVNNIFSELSDELYKLTENAANEFYCHGNRALLEVASAKTGLTPDEILEWW